MKKRVLSLFLAITLCLTLTPTGALAEESLPGQTVVATQETETPTPAPQKEEPLPEQTVAATQETETPTPAPQKEESTAPAENGADENASPASPDEKPTENTPAAPEKNPADEEPGKEAGQNEPTAEGKNEPLALGLDDAEQNAAEGENGEGSGGTHYVAESGGTQYETVQEILDNMEEGEITLLGNVTEDLTVYAATTIHMNGHSITGKIDATDSLTLNGGTVDGTVTVNATGGTFTMIAPAEAEAAITGGLNVVSGSAFVSGAQVGVKGTLSFDGTDMLISGAVKAVELDSAAEPAAKTLYGSATVNGDTAAEAGFDTDTYKVGGEIAKKLTNKQVGSTTPAAPSLTLTETSKSLTAGKTAVFTANYTGTDTLNAYVQGSAVNGYFTISQKNNGDGTYTVSVKIDEETPGGTYTLFVHELGNTSVQASATITVTGLPDAAEVNGKQYKSLPRALDAAQDGDTVKLLADHTTNWSDVEGGEYATLAVVKKTLTLDLNGMTVDYLTVGDVVPDEVGGGILDSYDGNLTVVDNIQGGSCGKIKNLEFVKGSLAIQGGQIGGSLTCDGNSGTVTISGGTVLGLTVGEGADVTVNGGSAHAGTWSNDGTLNITGGTFGNVRFLNNGGTIAISGGTFGTITNTNGSSSIPLMPLLADNYAFYQGDNAQNSTETMLTNVTVRPHTHSFENGKCDCGASYVASVTTSNGVTNNYTSLDDALDAAKDGDTVKLLGDAEITKWRWLTAAITLDLNGKTITTKSNAELYIRAQVIVQDNSTGKNGGMAGTYLLNVQEKGDLIIQSGTFDGKITINDGKLTIEGGIFKQEVDLRGGDSDSVFFSGGTFAKIWYPNSSGSFLDLLADGCAFYDNDGNLVNAAEISGPFLYNVRVQQHTHSFTDGACACGYTCPHTSVDESGACTVCGKQFAASITEGNDVTYYDLFNDALVYAFNNDGCTLKLLEDVTGTTVMINNPFLFDLNGHNVDALSVDARATIKDSGTTKGRIGKVTVSNEKVTDLTLGDLLEEGYAFKYENGYWADDSHKETISGLKVTVEEAPIKSVVLDAIGADKKEVPTTMAYGTTGAVTLEASCWINDMTVPTYTWYKLEGAAATAPMEGVNGVKYKLPADLPAGKHTYLVICTSGGYSKSAEITITVTPISLEGATVTVKDLTYNGQEQFPTVTVKLGDETLSRDNDYTVQVTKQANAGSYKLTIKGGGNYSGEIKDVEWKIEPMKIDSVMVSSGISKVYDGTAEINMSANEWATALKFKTRSAYDVVSVPSDAYTISDAYFVEKSGEETIHSPDAGEKYGITFKITLNDDNYVLQTYGEDTPSTSKVITQSGGATFTIKQATVTSPGDITQLVFNDLAKTYTIDLAKLLPKLSEGCEYGDIQYQGCDNHFTDSTYLDSNNGMSVSEEGILTLPTVSAHTSDVNTQIGTITVPVVTTNYQNFEFTIKVVISARIPLNASGVTVSASEITYGQTLNECKLTATGTMKHPVTGEEVKGTFAWTNPEAKPGAAGDYTASWTFTPAAGYEEYAPAIGTVTVKVNKATPAFIAPTAQENLTYTGQEQALITAGMTDHGTMQYSLTENGTYSQDIPTGTDAGAYTVWYRVIGDDNHNDTEPASVEVRIGKKPLTITRVTATSKPYDGTTNADITSVTFDNVTLKRDTDYNVTASFDYASVDSGKNVTATVTLMGQTAKNYFLEQSSFTTTGSITKAAAPDFTKETALAIINSYKKTYTVTLPALPKLETPKEYGAPTYELGEIKLNGGYYTDGAKVENGKLTLPIQKNDVETTGSVGTVTVVIKSINYEDITLTVNVSAVNKIKPTPVGEITASEITYGDTLSKSKISGKMKDPNTGYEVNGTFTWMDGTVKPDAGSNNATWTFTPDASYGGKYTTNNGTATVTVNRKTVTVSGITASDKDYDGNTNVVLDYSAVTLGGVLENDILTVTATGTLESADVGKQKVTISDLTLGGNSAANYVLAESGNQTQTTATITAKEVTATITPNGGTYGSVTAAAAELSGAVDGENVPVTLTYTGNGYNDTAVPVNAGSYTVTASIANSNYTLTGNTTADFVITPKAVTVSGITAKDKVYDGTTNAVLDYSNAQFDGILENDKLTVAAKGVFEKAEAGKQNVAISDLTLGGDSAANYVLAESGNQTETIATITAKEVTVTPDNKSKVYEEKDPKLTYIVSGVLSGETLTGITLTRAEGENAGEYDITGTADAGANPNYDVTFAKGTFTIKPKSIQSATVVLGKGLAANGAEQTQTVEKVLLNDKELPADSYTVAGNTATDPGSHTLTITAKGNYTGTVEQTYVIIPAKTEDAPGEEIAIGSGKVKVDVKSEGTVPPATLLTNKAELLAMLVDSGDITADELAQIADGASVDIALTVKEANVSAKIKTAMAQAAKDYTIGQYLDISLLKYMTVNGSQQADVALHTTKDALTISVVVPDALINTNSAVNRTYCIVRNHEGTITVLDAAFDAANKTLTFKTDHFSVYAIAYKDTAVPSSGSNPGSNNSSNDSETKKNEVAAPTPAPTPASTSKPSTITAMPQTGDTSNPTLYVVLLVVSLLGLAVIFVCKRRNNK
ncbi:MAG: LPXTG cell wall anchor domain-containing protein [Subdoligranulum variabile]|nr:LPXTG cell wall anchor domain-containing protein [Subdoligranulum variabile]